MDYLLHIQLYVELYDGVRSHGRRGVNPSQGGDLLVQVVNVSRAVDNILRIVPTHTINNIIYRSLDNMKRKR